MPRAPLDSRSISIEQKPDVPLPLTDPGGNPVPIEREPEIVTSDKPFTKAYYDELAFNEEWVKIRLEPTAEKNASTHFPIWVNGKGCEVLQPNGRIDEIAYIPVGLPVTIKRKYVEVIVRAKLDTIQTKVLDETSENPHNIVNRFTSAVHSFSILEDKNPLGIEWLTELRRRNF